MPELSSKISDEVFLVFLHEQQLMDDVLVQMEQVLMQIQIKLEKSF